MTNYGYNFKHLSMSQIGINDKSNVGCNNFGHHFHLFTVAVLIVTKNGSMSFNIIIFAINDAKNIYNNYYS